MVSETYTITQDDLLSICHRNTGQTVVGPTITKDGVPGTTIMSKGPGKAHSGHTTKHTSVATAIDGETGEHLSSEIIFCKVPVISWVQAGAWTDIVDEFQPGDADEFIQVFSNVSENTFALRISGDSMTPEFQPGEVITVDPAVQPETGKYVIAKIENGNNENGEATFKQFVRDGGSVYLKPLNDKYPMIDMTGKDFKIVGVVVEKVKKY